MNPKAIAAAPPPGAEGGEMVVYSPKARSAVGAPSRPQQQHVAQQPPAEQLQNTIMGLARANASLRGQKLRNQNQAAMAEIGRLRAQIANQAQMAQAQAMENMAKTQMLANAQARNLQREEYLAGLVKSARLQLPCSHGPWEETQRLLSLDQEVEGLRSFVEYQYQDNMLWGSDEHHSPRFWYEAGGFHGRRTGPGGDNATWKREKEQPKKCEHCEKKKTDEGGARI